jgi:uncharacterized membrane-anchored protein
LLDRFRRIRSEFGTNAFVRISVLLIALVGMAVLGGFAFSSPWPAVVGVVGLALGLLLRRPIVRGVKYYSSAVPIGLIAYAIVLIVGDQLGLTPQIKLIIITATTVVIFDLWFWSLSDPSIVNTERRSR